MQNILIFVNLETLRGVTTLGEETVEKSCDKILQLLMGKVVMSIGALGHVKPRSKVSVDQA